MRDARKNKNSKKPSTAEGRKLKQLLDELHGKEQQESAHRAEAILKLIRSRQAKKLPKLEDTMTEAQLKRLKPLAWLIDNQSYTTEEILMVALINEQKLSTLRESDLEYNRQLQQRD
jgi:hypothetical protein